MEYRIFILAISLLVLQVKAQLCDGPGSTTIYTPLNGPCAPPVIASPVVATTILDNSVSNALANALQLLIVSDLIQTRLSSVLPSNPLLNALSPAIDVVTPCAAPVEVIPPYIPVIENVAPTFYGGITETITPNIFGGYTETFTPNPFVTETVVPNYYGGWTETIASTPCGVSEVVTSNIGYGPNIATITPTYNGVTEVISANPFNNNIYGGYTEVVTPGCGPNFYGAEVVLPNYYAGVEVIAPSFNPSLFGPITEVIESPYPNFYGPGVSEIIAPMPQFTPPCVGGVPEFIPPLPFNPGCDVIGPPQFGPFNPGCIGNVAEVITPNPFGPYFGIKEVIAPTGPFAPVAAEVIFPQAIPAQLTCNFGYLPSSSLPCVSVNVEPLPFEPCGCGCNNFPRGLLF